MKLGQITNVAKNMGKLAGASAFCLFGVGPPYVVPRVLSVSGVLHAFPVQASQHAEGSPLIPKASVLHGLEELPKIPQMQGRAKLPTCEPANSTCQPAKAKCIFPIHQPTRRPPHRPTHSSAHAKHQHKSTHTHTHIPTAAPYLRFQVWLLEGKHCLQLHHVPETSSIKSLLIRRPRFCFSPPPFFRPVINVLAQICRKSHQLSQCSLTNRNAAEQLRCQRIEPSFGEIFKGSECSPTMGVQPAVLLKQHLIPQ